MEQYLEHHGILGMKWGVRRYQNKDGSLTEAGKRRLAMDKKSEELSKEANKVFNSSSINKKIGKLQKEFYRDHPDAAGDDFGDWLVDNHPELKTDYSSKYRELSNDAAALSRGYVKSQAIGSAFVSSVYLAPVAMYATKKIVETGKHRTLKIIASGVGTVGITTLMGAAEANKQKKAAIKKYGL